MSKPKVNYHSVKYHELAGYMLALTSLCLLVTWCIEILAKELFRFG